METQRELLKAQFMYLKKLKQLSDAKLRRKHDRVFIGSKYGVKIPRWMHRSILERRLFYYYCLKNYHYPIDHPVAKEFRRKARHILSAKYLEGATPEQQTKEELRNRDNFTATNIRAMPIVQVDRYLAGLSLFVEAPEETRRRILYEWFHAPSSHLIKHLNDKGEKVAPRRRGRLNNKFRLRDLILENPTLGYDAFREAFGNEMPTVTRSSFNNTRSLLKKAGYDLPPLKPGPSNPVVVTGIYGHLKRARTLNDTTTIGDEFDG